MERRPIIVITMGDPAGVGPEIIAKALAGPEVSALCRPVVIGDAGVMTKIIEELRLPIGVRSVSSLEAEPGPGTIAILSPEPLDTRSHTWGKPLVSSGSAVVAYIRKAVDLCAREEAAAMVTAPISKAIINAAGFRYAGHTELLADLTHSREYGMLFIGGGLRVLLATIHLSLSAVPKAITSDRILRTLRLAQNAMRSFGIEKPRIGVAALNPHAGEGGLFGTEEHDHIMPAVVRARAEGIDASEPLPADTLFYKALNKQFDIVVAMYHDQGLAPLKMLAFKDAVNVTVGLPIIRTSVDHGTAYDIAGKGQADPASLIQAIKIAATMASFRSGRPRG